MEYDLVENDGVFTLKNQNTTIGLEEEILPQNYLNWLEKKLEKE